MNTTAEMNSTLPTAALASISRRFGAVALDALILTPFIWIFNSIIPALGGALVWFLYAPFLESSALRATIGKKLMGIQVGGLDGRRISFRTAMIRALMKLISSMLMFIPHLVAFFTERKQAAHDLIADTVVVYGRAEIPVVDAWVDSAREVFRSDSAPRSGVGMSSELRLTELERLQSLYERGALTRDEFEAQKKRILES